MGLIGKENGFKINKYTIIAVCIAVAVISISNILTKSQESKDFNAFIEKCDFDRLEIISINKEDFETSTSNKDIICDLWKLVKNSKLPWHKEKKTYDYSLYLNLYKENVRSEELTIHKDKISDEVHITFYGLRSTFSMSGIDENKLIEKLEQMIIDDN